MITFVDVYKRPLKVGDAVLCSYYGNDMSNTLINDTLMVLGDEKVVECDSYDENMNVIPKNEVRICYKLEDPELIQAAFNFDYNNWRARYNSLGVEFVGNYEGVAHTNIIEMLGRPLNAGDFIIYDYKKTKVNYGLVIGNHQILTETGAIKKQNYGLLLKHLTMVEVKIKNTLMTKYQEIVKSRLTTKTLNSLNDIQNGQVYLTKDNKHLIICFDKVGYTVHFKGTGVVSTSPKYDSFCIQMSISLKIAKDIIDKLKEGRNIEISSLFKQIGLQDFFDGIYAYWDDSVLNQLMPYKKYIMGYNLYMKDRKEWSDWINSYIHRSLVLQIFNGYMQGSKTKCLSIKGSNLGKGASILGFINLKDSVILDNELYKIVLHV